MKEIKRRKKYSLLYLHFQRSSFFPIDASLHLVLFQFEELPSASIVVLLILSVFICLKMSLLHLPFLKDILAGCEILGWDSFLKYHPIVFWPVFIDAKLAINSYHCSPICNESFSSGCFQVCIFICSFQQYDCDWPGGFPLCLSCSGFTELLEFYKRFLQNLKIFSRYLFICLSLSTALYITHTP